MSQWLVLVEDVPGVDPADDLLVCLVPERSPQERTRLRTVLAGRRAVLGPVRGGNTVQVSFIRALRARSLGPHLRSTDCLDTDDHPGELVVGADPAALADLRAAALAPLAELRPATADKLTEILRLWLLHHGREDIATGLFVHPQTVRLTHDAVAGPLRRSPSATGDGLRADRCPRTWRAAARSATAAGSYVYVTSCAEGRAVRYCGDSR